MTAHKKAIIGIGNALIDITFHVPSLSPFNLTPESAQLLPIDKWNALHKNLGKPVNASPGGSAGNTIAGIAGLGAPTGLIGLVGNDSTGKLLKRHLSHLNIDSYLVTSENNDPTGCCIVLITPDGKRTMATCLGAAAQFAPHHVPTNTISQAHTLFLEGYLFDQKNAQQAFVKAASTAKENHVKVAFSLSDPACVRNHRDAIISLLPLIDILFVNKEEALILTQTSSITDACQALSKLKIPQAAITLEDKGAISFDNNSIHISNAYPISHVRDLNGAGDAFAAGFLFALSLNIPFHDATKTANYFAAHVVETDGPRLNKKNMDFVKKQLTLQDPRFLG